MSLFLGLLRVCGQWGLTRTTTLGHVHTHPPAMQSSLDQLEATPPQVAFVEQEHDFLFLPTPAYRKAMLLTTLDCTGHFHLRNCFHWACSVVSAQLGPQCGGQSGPAVEVPEVSSSVLMPWRSVASWDRPVALVLLNRESQRPGNRGCQRGAWEEGTAREGPSKEKAHFPWGSLG